MRTAIALCFGVVALSFSVQAADEPRKPQSAAAALGLTPLEHAVELFPILPWDVIHDAKKPSRSGGNGIESVAECNFPIAGFVRQDDLPLCEKLGLAAILLPPAGKQPWVKLSDEQIDRGVREMTAATAKHKAVLGYYIMDEPGVQAFAALGKVVAAVKKYAPGKLAYINLFPSYATVGAPNTSQLGAATYTEYLERFVNEVKPQFLSYDNYMVEYADDLADAKRTANYFADLLEVRRVGQKYSLPFWNIVSCNQIRSQTTIPTPANLALQAYTTLAAGGRGVSWFKYYQDGYAYAPIDNTGKKTETWRYLQLVNRQVRVLGPIMNRLRSTGVGFTAPSPVKSLSALPGRIVTKVASKASPRGISKAEPPIMVGEFSDERGADYVMLVNLSLERSTNVKLETAKPYKLRQVFSAEDGRLQPLDEKNGHWLAAGQGLLLKLE
jgi:hypothetical protein